MGVEHARRVYLKLADTLAFARGLHAGNDPSPFAACATCGWICRKLDGASIALDMAMAAESDERLRGVSGVGVIHEQRTERRAWLGMAWMAPIYRHPEPPRGPRVIAAAQTTPHLEVAQRGHGNVHLGSGRAAPSTDATTPVGAAHVEQLQPVVPAPTGRAPLTSARTSESPDRG